MTQQKQNGNIIAIIVMIFLFGMISFVTNLASPMGDILKFQFGVPNWMGTLGVFANFIAYAVMGYPSGHALEAGLQEDGSHCRHHRLRGCRHPNAVGRSRQLRHLPAGSFHLRFLYVFAQYSSESHAEQFGWRRQ